jgi:hypothetical protein
MVVLDSSPRASAVISVKNPQRLTLADRTFFPPGCCAVSWGRARGPAGLAPEALEECVNSFKVFFAALLLCEVLVSAGIGDVSAGLDGAMRTYRHLSAFGAYPGGVVGVLDRQTYQGGTRGSRLCGGDRDRETENSKVRARTRDTRFIQVRAVKVANPTSCLGDQVWRPALGVGRPRRDRACAARYPALLYIVQGVGS